MNPCGYSFNEMDENLHNLIEHLPLQEGAEHFDSVEILTRNSYTENQNDGGTNSLLNLSGLVPRVKEHEMLVYTRNGFEFKTINEEGGIFQDANDNPTPLGTNFGGTGLTKSDLKNNNGKLISVDNNQGFDFFTLKLLSGRSVSANALSSSESTKSIISQTIKLPDNLLNSEIETRKQEIIAEIILKNPNIKPGQITITQK